MALEFGLNSHDLLTAGKLTPEDIKQPKRYISSQQYMEVASCLNNEGLDKKAPVHWGLELGQRLTIASHGLLSLAIMIQYKNLVTALNCLPNILIASLQLPTKLFNSSVALTKS